MPKGEETLAELQKVMAGTEAVEGPIILRLARVVR